MAEHTHVFVWVASTRPWRIVQRCACGQPGPLPPRELRPARKFRGAS